MNSNQIQIESSVSKSNPTRANLIWIYLLTSLIEDYGGFTLTELADTIFRRSFYLKHIF
jgi:hypothetical protein